MGPILLEFGQIKIGIPQTSHESQCIKLVREHMVGTSGQKTRVTFLGQDFDVLLDFLRIGIEIQQGEIRFTAAIFSP